MSHRHVLHLVLCGVLLAAGAVAGQSASASSQAGARPGYDIDYIGPPLPDPVMQHAKETYVTFGCAYCHGMTLIARGEAADLMHSALVGADINGDSIAALLRAGIPQTAKLSPMPQFSDLSDQQLHDIARYIHYARQQGRYREIVEAKTAAGDAAAGRTDFDQNCVSCHASDLVGIAKKYDASALRDHMIRPIGLTGPQSFKLDALHDTRMATARQRHNFLLENWTPVQVANLVAYLQTK
jgi:mono/diheme cytochrome c family protein